VHTIDKDLFKQTSQVLIRLSISFSDTHRITIVDFGASSQQPLHLLRLPSTNCLAKTCFVLLCTSVLQGVAVRGRVLQCVAGCCSVVQCVTACCIGLLLGFRNQGLWLRVQVLSNTATYSNTLQHTATHCNTLQRTATHCNTHQHTVIHCNALQHTSTYCNTL